MRSVPILTYHQISPTPHPKYVRFTVTPELFARQMAWLAARGYATVTLDALMAAREGRGSLPSRPIVLTFDDGCVECVEHATRIMSAYGFTGIFYLVTGFMGATSRWTLARREVEFPLIDWAAARRLIAAGFTVGSHTVTHPRLAELPPEACREELHRSRAVLQDRLGVDVVHLSYPFGSFDAGVRRMAVEAGYLTACSIQSGLSTAADDRLSLHRLNIGGDETFTDFRFRVITGRRADQVLPGPVYTMARRARSFVRTWTGLTRSAAR